MEAPHPSRVPARQVKHPLAGEITEANMMVAAVPQDPLRVDLKVIGPAMTGGAAFILISTWWRSPNFG